MSESQPDQEHTAAGHKSALKFYALLGLAVLLGCMAVTAAHLMSPDEELLYRTAESLALEGNLAVDPIETDPQTGELLVPPRATFATVQGRNGEFHVQYLPLQPVLAVPLVWLGKVTEPVFAEAFFGTLPASPMHHTETAAGAWRRAVVVALFNPLVTALTALVLARLVLLLTSGNRRAAAGTALLFAFATMALPHSRTFFTEPLAGLLGLVAVDALARWYYAPLDSANASRRLKLMLVFGLALAGAIWTRMDSPLLAFGLGLALVGAGEWKRRIESAYGTSPGGFPLRDYAVSGGLVIGSFILLLIFNNWRFAGNASLLGGGYSDQAEGVALSTPVLVGLHGLLFSPGKGLFFFSPAAILGIWGWFRLPRHLRWFGLAIAVGYLPFALAMVKWQNWEGGWCWGPRHIVQLHAPLVLGAMTLLGDSCRRPVRNGVIKAIAIVGLLVQLFGSLQSPLDFYHEFFRTPNDNLVFRVGYRPTEVPTVTRHFATYARDARTGGIVSETTPLALPAPMVDSLYLPHHTQWAGYPAMLREGYCDWWLLARVLPLRNQRLAAEESAGVR